MPETRRHIRKSKAGRSSTHRGGQGASSSGRRRTRLGSGSSGGERQRSSGRLRTASSTATSRQTLSSSSGSEGTARTSVIGTQATRMQTRVDMRQQGVRGRQVSLRTKFMLLMAGLAGIGLISLGVTMAQFANSYLFGQTVHKGIEIVKMAAAVANATVEPRTSRTPGPRPVQPDSQTLQEMMSRYYENATRWGQERGFSDILSITFYGGGQALSGFTALGREMEEPGPRGRKYDRVFIPRTGGKVLLPDDIEVYQFDKPVDGRVIPVYRFAVQLNKQDGSYGENTIRVDIAGDTVQEVANRLYITIGIGTVVIIVLVLLVSQLFASRITNPLRLLVRDMKIVAKGDLNHVTKSHSNDEVGLLAHEFNRMTGDLKEAQNILVEQEKAAYELSIASEVQQQLLPAERPQIHGWELGSFYQGAKAVSGDYYDFIPLGDGLWGFIIADVSGKGIPGSMVMSITRTIVRLVANRHRSNAAETLKDTNRLIAKQIKRGMFVTAFYAVLDENTGQVTFASAGHNPMVVYRAQQQRVELAAPKGIAIGFNEGPLFDKNIQQFQITLAPGDAMTLYTDGFPEAMNEHDEEWGDDNFYASIRDNGHRGGQGIVEGLVEDVARHRGNAAQSDDLTMVVVSRRTG